MSQWERRGLEEEEEEYICIYIFSNSHGLESNFHKINAMNKPPPPPSPGFGKQNMRKATTLKEL
jgi:hypothetical protein